MNSIEILESSTIDKIAAGEVVEKPASVVKELLENAVDSGAEAVTVEIKEGGISLIRVTDNGCGIPKDQIKKAFLRHATSKIRHVEDLYSISSLGFRGEALSSICAVAQVEMISKTNESLTGGHYVIEGAKEKSMEEVGAPEGTTILVRNLFFNTPARKKFLKTSHTEASYITDLMEHMALSHPDISFKYVINGILKFHTSGNGDIREIIYRIYGREISSELVEISEQTEGMTLHGYLGTPVINRANRNFENYYVNGRYIKDKIIAKAAEDAYKEYLMQHKYPFFVLYLDMNPEFVDVNVHPAKMEVRFSNPAEVSNFLFQNISSALKNKEMLKEISLPDTQEEEKTQREQRNTVKNDMKKESAPEPFEKVRLEQGRTGEEPVYSVTEEKTENTVKNEDYYAKSDKNAEKECEMQENLHDNLINKVISSINSTNANKNMDFHTNIIKKKEHIIVEKPVQMNLFEEKIVSENARNEYVILGQAFDTYWLITYKDKILFMDQHAAHEKVKYERLYKQFQENNVISQNLNPPIILTLSGKEEGILNKFQEYFEKLGFTVESFGGNEYAVRSVPVDLFGCEEKRLFEEILDELTESELKGAPCVIASKIASMACKAAVKGNHSMSLQEAEKLLDELMKLENPYHCPHGRPTIITMSKYELEKKFSRIVS